MSTKCDLDVIYESQGFKSTNNLSVAFGPGSKQARIEYIDYYKLLSLR